MKKLLAFVTAAALLFGMIIPAAAFSDVDNETDSGKAITYLSGKQIVGGYEDGSFRPNGTITRAELCKLINICFKYSGLSDAEFPDVGAGDWFYSYAKTARKAGYIGGYEDGTFRGGAKVTREQFCTIITRCMGLYLLSDVDISDRVSPWAETAVKTVLSNSLMTTDENGNFRATESITRAEVAVVLANYVKAQEQIGNIVVGPGSGGTDVQPDAAEPEEITAIRNGVTQIEAAYDKFDDKAKKVIDPCLSGMKRALAEYETNGTTIDKDFLYNNYGDLIKEAQQAYNALSSTEQSFLKGDLVKYLDTQTISILMEYFMGD